MRAYRFKSTYALLGGERSSFCPQSGNKKWHSTETSLIYTSDRILTAIDQKKTSAVVLLDMSKAFDSVNHDILLKKLQDIGLSPSAILWFKSYLSNRYQAVRINTTLSEPLLMRNGVPQCKEASSVLCSSRLTPMTCHQSHTTVPRTATLMTLNCLCHSKCRTVNRLWPR